MSDCPDGPPSDQCKETPRPAAAASSWPSARDGSVIVRHQFRYPELNHAPLPFFAVAVVAYRSRRARVLCERLHGCKIGPLAAQLRKVCAAQIVGVTVGMPGTGRQAREHHCNCLGTQSMTLDAISFVHS
jgi:hypothetical protein